MHFRREKGTLKMHNILAPYEEITTKICDCPKWLPNYGPFQIPNSFLGETSKSSIHEYQ